MVEGVSTVTSVGTETRLMNGGDHKSVPVVSTTTAPPLVGGIGQTPVEEEADIDDDQIFDHAFDSDFNILSSIEWTDHVDYCYQLKDPKTRSRFTQFHEAHSTGSYPLLISLFSLVALVGHSFLLQLDLFNNDSSVTQWIPLDVILIVVSIVTCGVGLGLVYLEHIIKEKLQQKASATRERGWKRTLTYIFFTIIGVYVNLYAIRRSLGVVCDHHDNSTNHSFGFEMRENQRVVSSIFCGYDNTDDRLPVEVILSLFIWPMTIITVSPSISMYYVWGHVLVAMSNFIALTSIRQQQPSLYLLLCWIFVNIFLVITIQGRNVSTYLFHWKLKEMLRDNEKMAEEFHISEMRYVIANMAHDLKTPLTSFITGMDLIKQTVQESERQLNPATNGGNSDGDVDINTIKSCLSSIKQCVNNITDTNSFMLMTINRCIDYAKAAKGIKLVPRPETIDLWETMQLPAVCLRNVQDRVQIVLTELTPEICTHVITDKQWLQENLLCLLSNAVKYTTKGSVALSVTLIATKTPYNNQYLSSPKSATRSAAFREEGATATSPSSPSVESHRTNLKRSQEADSLIEAAVAMRSSSAGLIDLELGSRNNTGDSGFFPNRVSSVDVMDVSVTIGGVGSNSGKSEAGASSLSGSPSRPQSQGHNPDRIAIVSSQPTQAPPTTIETSTGAPANTLKYLLFEVEDNGIGIPSDAREKLFKPFRQTQRLAGGTGLGLYSLAKRVEGIHGDYGVRNRKDGSKGSLFWFTVPYRPDEATAMLKARRARSNSGYSTATTETADEMNGGSVRLVTNTAVVGNNNNRNSNGSNNFRSSLPGFVSNLTLHVDGPTMSELVTPRPGLISMNNASLPKLDVLIVDDSLSILKMTSMMLRKLGHSITTAENGEIAVNTIEERWRLKRESFDVILMDLQMPVMDGLEATKRIRVLEMEGSQQPYQQRPRRSSYDEDAEDDDDDDESFPIPRQLIIGVSANSDYETSDVALTAGVDAFIAKPFTVDTFQKTVMNCLFKR